MTAGKVNFFRGSWLADYPDAENYFAVFYSKNSSPPNYTKFNNTGYDLLYEKALAENDDIKRYEIYHQMEQIIIEEAPVVPLFYDEVLRFSQKNIEGLEPNALNLLDLKRVKLSDKQKGMKFRKILIKGFYWYLLLATTIIVFLFIVGFYSTDIDNPAVACFIKS